MYTEGQTVILTQDVGKKGTDFYFPKDSKAEFVKTLSDSIEKPYVAVKLGDKTITLPELAIRIENEKEYLKALEAYNQKLMKDNPLLRQHHPNPLIRSFWRLYFRLKRILAVTIKRFSGEVSTSPDSPSLDRVKDILKED